MTCIQGIKIHQSHKLANLTTWRIGGPAEFLAEPINIKELQTLLIWANAKNINCNVIGAGSNLLINDSGLNGLSICLRKLQGSSLNKKSGLIDAFAGESIPNLARKAAKAGLHGLEWAVGIPGTVGGAAVMNAGAQGSQIQETLHSVLVMPRSGTDPFIINSQELNFSYRYSRLQEEKLIVLSAKFLLEPGHDQKELSHITHQNLIHRTSTQPYHLPSCGSVFRNPEPLKAGQIIEGLGLKGKSIGGAEISKLHANFIINTGEGTAADIKQLIQLVQRRVKKTHDLELQTEVKQLGF